MDAPDPAELLHRRAIAAASRLAPTRACPSCGADLPPRRLFCTEYCRTAVHRIRRTEADLARLRSDQARAASEAERLALATEISRLEAKRAERDDRLARRRGEVLGAAARADDDQATG
jgi:predicted nucleic acid-binding Zn ribbon protein